MTKDKEQSLKDFDEAIREHKARLEDLEDLEFSDYGRDLRFVSPLWLPILIFIFAAFFLGAWQLVKVADRFMEQTFSGAE